MNNENSGTIIEMESLALQSANATRPWEVLYPPSVTKKMLENAGVVENFLSQEYPNNPIGLSLHTGTIVDLRPITESDIPITSIDVPEAVSVREATLEKFINCKITLDELPKRLVYAINCSLGLTKEKAEENRLQKIDKVKELNRKEFNRKPFIRMPGTSPQEISNMIKAIPQNWNLAVEYIAESEFNPLQLINYISHLNMYHPNIGLSLDLPHFLESFIFDDGDRNSEDIHNYAQFVINLFQNILLQSPHLVMSVDINNMSPDTDRLAQTHKNVATPGGIFDNRKVMEIYRRCLDRNNMDGRVDIEPSPLDLDVYLSPDGLGYISYQLEPIKK